MASKKWVMPEWMREVWNQIGDLCPTGKENQRVIDVLERLHTAGLLLTPGEKRDIAEEAAEALREKLRAEIRELLQEINEDKED